MMIRYVLCWFVLVIIAIGNGVLREFTYGKSMSEIASHQISTLTGIVFSGVFVWFLSSFWPLESAEKAWTIGVIWLVMTIGFEFLFGHYVAGHSWQRLIGDYNILAGRIWLVFLVWVTVMPYIFFRLR